MSNISTCSKHEELKIVVGSVILEKIFAVRKWLFEILTQIHNMFYLKPHIIQLVDKQQNNKVKIALSLLDKSY